MPQILPYLTSHAWFKRRTCTEQRFAHFTSVSILSVLLQHQKYHAFTLWVQFLYQVSGENRNLTSSARTGDLQLFQCK